MQARQRVWFYPNINVRIITPFLLLVVIIAGLGIFITTRLVASSIQERFTNQLADSATTAINAFVDIERQQLGALRLMAFTTGVSDAIGRGDAHPLEALLQPLVGSSTFEEIIVFDRSAQPIIQFSVASGSAPLDAQTIASWPVVQNVIRAQADAVGDKFSATIDLPNGAVFVISAPVTDDAGTLVGGIVGATSLKTAAIRLSQQALSNVVIYDPHNKVLATTFPVSLSTLALPEDTFARVSKALPATSPLEDITVDGRPYQALYIPFTLRQSSVGILAVALPSNFIVERSSTSRDIFGMLFSALFVVVVVMGLVVAQTITNPVARLVATARAIRDGDLSQRVGLRIPDELGELGASFDAMTDQLVRRNVQVNKLYQEQLIETARRDAVFSSISEALFVLDPDGTVILRNPKADSLVREISAKTHGRFRSFFLRAKDRIGTRTIEVQDQTFLVNTTPVSMERGDLGGYVVSFQDISPLLETERIKDDLIKQISHELRTPLTAIRGYVELIKTLEEHNLSDQGNDFADQALDNLTIMSRLVNEVIDVSVIVSNSFELDRRPFDLSQMLGARFEYWGPIMQARELTLARHFPNNLVIEGDEARLAQTLDHLLLNAYSYSLPGGAVTLRAGSDNQHITITILDEGVGIAADELDKVFERMYRGRSAGAGDTDSRGLGLGLYLSKRIVEMHHGTISLQSRPQQGTIVRITLPCGAPHRG
jgi:two-component system sensor histidine kinase VicK